mgnify:CR=1 FL=1
MSFSQATQFEQHVNNQLSKSLGAIPVLFPILRRLRAAQTINDHCSGAQEVNHGTAAEILEPADGAEALVRGERVDGRDGAGGYVGGQRRADA